MTAQLDSLIYAMMEYYKGDAKRIQHFLKVHQLARLIGHKEQLEEQTQLILETAALVHDIGIKPAEEKFGSCDGKLQEQEGPAPARAMLQCLEFDSAVIDRVCYLVAHHHTYSNIDGLDYQILVEADFLVNLYEDGCDKDAARTACAKVFRTKAGIALCICMYNL